MANTYTQIHIHAIFCVQNRWSLINPKWEKRLYGYIGGIINNKGHKVLAINGMPDHIHVLFGLRPIQSLSELMREVKGGSSRWINENKLVTGKFKWQEGYGAFSYSKSQLQHVIRYILNQKEHHQIKSFNQEYLQILEEFEVEFDNQYVFKEMFS